MTQEEFNQDYGRIAMPKPFAHDGLITPIVDIGDSTHPVNFADGFPSEYSAPHSQGGKYVTRGEFNAIGNLATRNDFYRACGGLNTFDADFASKIRGYPKDAVLQLLDNNVLKYVISLVDNNKVNFNAVGVDGVNWKFCYESKHEDEEGEGFVDHVDLTDIPVDIKSSINVFAKLSPRNGFVSIRNVRFKFDGFVSGTGFTYPFFLGSGIVVKAFENPETIYPMRAWEGTQWPGWRVARTLRTGDIDVSWNGGKWMADNFFGAIQMPGDEPYWGNFISIPINTGLIAIRAGEYIVIDIINGYSNVSGVGALSASDVNNITYQIKSLSFDIYII